MSEIKRLPSQSVLDAPLTLNDINELICESFDFEVIRLNLRHGANNDSDVATKVESVGWLYLKYLETDFAMFFTLRNITKLTEEIFQNVNRRRFILDLVERVSNGLAGFPADVVSTFEAKIKTRIERTRVYTGENADHNCLIVEEIASSYYASGQLLEPMFKDNFWILVVYQLLMYFHQTSTFLELSGKQMKATSSLPE